MVYKVIKLNEIDLAVDQGHGGGGAQGKHRSPSPIKYWWNVCKWNSLWEGQTEQGMTPDVS